MGVSGTDLEELTERVALRLDAAAPRAFDAFVTACPGAASWSTAEREAFSAQARHRMTTVLELALAGQSVEEPMLSELAEIGAAAALDDPPPELAALVRSSRDALAHAAVEAAAEDAHRFSEPLALLLGRLLRVVDAVSDALESGFRMARSAGPAL